MIVCVRAYTYCLALCLICGRTSTNVEQVNEQMTQTLGSALENFMANTVCVCVCTDMPVHVTWGPLPLVLMTRDSYILVLFLGSLDSEPHSTS